MGIETPVNELYDEAAGTGTPPRRYGRNVGRPPRYLSAHLGPPSHWREYFPAQWSGNDKLLSWTPGSTSSIQISAGGQSSASRSPGYRTRTSTGMGPIASGRHAVRSARRPKFAGTESHRRTDLRRQGVQQQPAPSGRPHRQRDCRYRMGGDQRVSGRITVAWGTNRPEDHAVRGTNSAGTQCWPFGGRRRREQREPSSFPGFVEPPAISDAAMAVAAVDSQMRIGELLRTKQPGHRRRRDCQHCRSRSGGGVERASFTGWARLPRWDQHGDTARSRDRCALVQATGSSGAGLWNKLTQSVRPLNLPSADVGAGFGSRAAVTTPGQLELRASLEESCPRGLVTSRLGKLISPGSCWPPNLASPYSLRRLGGRGQC